ncbi:MAG: hypothetical protein AAGE05_12490 [Pseudomonadota bacterium]
MEKIGILFVHGIGEQARFEHLRHSVRDYAELLKSADQRAVSIVDHTADWKAGPNDPPFGSRSSAPMTIQLRGGGSDCDIECHEVWWADLGARETLGEKLLFWWWGLGQWSAPIYRELDPTGITATETVELTMPEQAKGWYANGAMAQMPRSSAGNFLEEAGVRLRLAMAGLTAILTAFSWSLLKRLVGFFADAPSTTLIFQYVGDVRTYERRAMPNQSRPGDPGQPLRVPIRRRMVSQMVAMASRDYDRWYISAHSLGTVVAYNGLTETGHALPNYLNEASWDALPGPFKDDTDARLRSRDEIHKMMPARPAWLDYEDVISRPRLFEKLAGFLTYGSPLDKFAAIWPRIVATATDRESGDNPFPDTCDWLNLNSPNDPVSGRIDSYSDEILRKNLPRLRNVATDGDLLPGLSHIRYFLSRERSVQSDRVKQRFAIMDWLLGADVETVPDHRKWYSNLFAMAQFLLVIAVLAILTGAVTTFAGGVLAWAGVDVDVPKFETWAAFWVRFCHVMQVACGAAIGLLTLSGTARWWRESRLNHILATHDGKQPLTRRFLGVQRDWAALCVLLSLVAIPAALIVDLGFYQPPKDWWPAGWAWTVSKTLVIAPAILIATLVIQSAINRYFTRQRSSDG